MATPEAEIPSGGRRQQLKRAQRIEEQPVQLEEMQVSLEPPSAAPPEEVAASVPEAAEAVHPPTFEKPLSKAVAAAHEEHQLTQDELQRLLTSDGRWRSGRGLENAIEQVLAERRLRAPTPIPIDITTDQVESLLDAFNHNRRVAVGGDGVKGLIEEELDRILDRQGKIDRGKGKIEKRLEEYGKPGWLGEARAVASARSELNTANDAKKTWEKQRAGIMKRVGINEAEVALYQRFYSIDEVLAQEGVSEDRIRQVAEEAGFVWTNEKDFRAFFTNSTTIQTRYVTYKGLREQDAIPQLEPESSIVGRITEAQVKLNNAEKKAEAIQRAQRTIGAKLPAVERRLNEWGKRVDRIGTFALRQYVPNTQEVSTALDELTKTQAKLAKREGQLADSEEVALIGERKLKNVIKALQETSRRQKDTIADLTDPKRRLAQCEDLARGLELVDQEGLDPARLSHEDRFQLAVVQTLLGMPVTTDLGPVPAGTKVEPAELPAKEVAQVEEEVLVQPPEERMLSQISAEELNAMPTEELAVVASQLAQEQIAGLSPQKIIELTVGDHLSLEQIASLSEDAEAAGLNSQLAGLADESPERAAGVLKSSVEAADRGEEGIARDTELPRVIADNLKRVAQVVRQHLPGDRARNPITLEEVHQELTAQQASEDPNIARKASEALKFLGLAIIGMGLLSTGGSRET